jgi:splicing factor U2AF 65 kDa subunit
LQIEIPRPDLETGLVGPCVGKVFVKFEFLIPAKKCRHYINGRVYNKKTVVASFYNEEKFSLKEYLLKL